MEVVSSIPLRPPRPPPPLERPPELAELDLDHSAVVEASAGTGKTYLLEHLVLELLITGRARLDEILVVTFTERATAELVARIRRKIDAALEAGNQRTRVVGWTIDEPARTRLAEARRAFSDASISTIHSFCQRILLDEPLTTGRLLVQTQVDGRKIFGEAFRDVLRRALATDVDRRRYLEAYLDCGRSVDALEDLLYAAASARGAWPTSYDENAFARAAAALGALRLDALDLEKVLRRILHPNSVPALMRRLRRLLPIAREAHAAGAWGQLLGLLDDDSELFSYFETIAAQRDVPAVAEPLRQVAQELLQAAPPLEEAIIARFLPVVEQELERRKLAEGFYDYDDMIASVDEALARPEGAALANKLASRYRFAVVDEAQDIEPGQWRIFRRIFLDSERPHPVILIGDPKQAIYGFRGADVHTYVTAREEIRARQGAVVQLDCNYRSHAEVVEACNAIFDDAAAERYFTDEAIRYDHPVRAAKPALGNGAGVTLLKVDAPASGGAPRIGTIKRALRDAIAAEIADLRNRAPTFRLSETYVLCRSNADSREVSIRLREAGIPNVQFKPDCIFESPEAAHVRALLLAIANPDDRASRLRAWLTPFFDVPLDALARGADPPSGHPLLTRLGLWKALADARNYDDLWPRILDDSGLVRRLRLSPAGARQLTNYRHLFDVLHVEAAARPCSVADLAALLASFAAGHRRGGPAGDDTQRLETEADAVRVMTIHAAKGLEADFVFLYGGLTSARFWRGEVHSYQRGNERLLCAGKPRRGKVLEAVDQALLQEDERLLYVAMTRARVHLYLPFFPTVESGDPDSGLQSGGEFDAFKKISGPYRHVNRRLRALAAEPGRAPLFHVKTIPADATPALAAPTVLAALAAWMPAPSGLPAVTREPGAAQRSPASRRGFVITSYSRLKQGQGGYQPPVADPAEASDDRTSSILGPTETAPGRDADARADVLPGGVASGLFLHAVLERTTLGELPPFAIWRGQRDVRSLIDTELRRWDRHPRHFDAAAKLIHAALTTDILLPDGSILPGIARAARIRREVDFLFPLPDGTSAFELAVSAERTEPSPFRRTEGPARASTANDVRAERGFLRGVLDVIFEHQGKIFFADWKSDALPAFDGRTLAAHMDANYDLQVRLYTLALVRLLRIENADDYQRRFGGLVYVFLRGLGGTVPRPSDGIWVQRPTFEQAQSWERELVHLAPQEATP